MRLFKYLNNKISQEPKSKLYLIDALLGVKDIIIYNQPFNIIAPPSFYKNLESIINKVPDKSVLSYINKPYQLVHDYIYNLFSEEHYTLMSYNHLSPEDKLCKCVLSHLLTGCEEVFVLLTLPVIIYSYRISFK